MIGSGILNFGIGIALKLCGFEVPKTQASTLEELSSALEGSASS